VPNVSSSKLGDSQARVLVHDEEWRERQRTAVDEMKECHFSCMLGECGSSGALVYLVVHSLCVTLECLNWRLNTAALLRHCAWGLAVCARTRAFVLLLPIFVAVETAFLASTELHHFVSFAKCVAHPSLPVCASALKQSFFFG
jgi:hypothetical protein